MEDALNAKCMNLPPGRKQPKMHYTNWGGKPQKLSFDDGVPNGMKQVLEEREIITRTLHKGDVRIILANQEDLRTEKTIVEQHITSWGHAVLFIPKFHCELNSIECVWGQGRFTHGPT